MGIYATQDSSRSPILSDSAISRGYICATRAMLTEIGYNVVILVDGERLRDVHAHLNVA